MAGKQLFLLIFCSSSFGIAHIHSFFRDLKKGEGWITYLETFAHTRGVLYYGRMGIFY